MAEIDSLEISIQSTVDVVNKSLDALIGKLGIVARGISAIRSNKGLNEFAEQAKAISQSMGDLGDKVSKSLNPVEDEAKKVSKSLSEITDQYKDLGKGFRIEGSTQAVQKGVEKYTNALEMAKIKKQELEASGKTSGNMYEYAIRDIQKYSNMIDSLKNQLADMGKPSQDLSAMSETELDEWFKNLPSIKAQAQEAFDGVVNESREAVTMVTNQWNGVKIPDFLKMETGVGDSLGQNINEVGKKLKNATISAQEFKEVLDSLKVPETNENNITKLQTKLKNVEEQTQKLEYSLEKGLRFGDIDFDDKKFRSLTVKIKESELTAEMLRNKIAQLNAEMKKSSPDVAEGFRKNLKNLQIPEIRTNSLEKLKKDLARAEAQLDKLRAKLKNDITMGRVSVDFNDAGYRKAREQIALTEKQIQAIKEKMKTADSTASKTSGYSALSKAMSTIEKVGKSLQKTFHSVISQISRFASSVKKLASSGFKKLSDNIKTVNTNIKKMAKSMKDAIKSNSNMDISFKKALKTVLKYGLGIRSLCVLINKLRSATVEGFKNLSLYSDEVNGSLSSVLSSLFTLKNALAVAFAPIVNVVAPYISKFIDMMTNASNAIGRFLSALTGKQYAVQAKKVYKDFANTVAGATEEVKDLNKAVGTIGIDELNILSDTEKNKDKELLPEDMFETVLIEKDIADWAKRIRDAFLNQDWEGLGKEIAELVNKGLQKIYDFIKNITPKVEQALKNFAKVFNSFVENLDWELLGRTLGAGINLLTKAFNALFGDEGIDLENLGKKLSVGFRGMVDEIDWTELGNALGNGFMIAWRIADGFIQDMWRIDPKTLLTGWEELGIGIGEAINGIFDRINFEQIARVLTDGFRGVLETVATALETIDFTFIANKINAGLEALYNGLKWDNGMGDTITRFTSAVSDAFNDLLNIDFGTIGSIVGAGIANIVRAFNQLTDPTGGINFEQLGQNISDGLRNLFSNIPWEEFGNALGNGFMVAWRILDGFLNNMAQTDGAGLTGWAQLGISIGNAINGIFQKIDFSVIAQVLVNGFNGIIEALRNFIDTVNWEDISTNLTNGLNTLVNGVDWKGAGETLSNLVIELLGVFQRVANDFDWEGFGRSVGEFLSSIDWMTIIGQVFDILWTVFSGFISGLFDTKTGKVVVGIAAGMLALEGVFKGLKLIGTVTTLVKTISTIFSGLSLIFSPAGAVIAAIVAGAALIIANWDKIKDAVKALWDNVLVPFGNFLKDIFVSIWDDMLKPVLVYIAENVIPKLMETLRNLWDNVLQPLGNFILEVFTPVFDVLSSVLESLWKNVVIPVADAIGGLFASAFKALWAIINDLIIPVFKSVINVLKILWEKLMKPIVEWVRDTLGPILEQVFEAVGDKIGGLIDTLSDVLDFLAGLMSGVGDTLSSIIDMIGEVLGNLFDIFGGIIDIITGVFTGDWEKAWNGVVEVFRGIFNLIPSIAEGVINGAIGLINGIINGINNITDKVGIPDIPNIPEVKLPRFEMGGFPEDGLFLANHNELVGQFTNGQTAVANNAQIVEGIKQGVKEAVSEILAPYLEDIAQNTKETANKEMSVNLDGRQLVTFTDERRARNGYVF